MHAPVLLRETIELLSIRPDGRYVDGTLGAGGHAEAILEKLNENGCLLAMDADEKAIEMAKQRLGRFGSRIRFRRANFVTFESALREEKWDAVDGVLLDLGISSVQLDDPERGLSFQASGPLDMRIDRSAGPTALMLLQTNDQQALEKLFREYGEFRDARRLARAITHDVSRGLIQTTGDLASLCQRICGRHGPTHPATRVFLALRSAVNRERENLETILSVTPRTLRPGGRFAVISFQSTEDRAVKEQFRAVSSEPSAAGVFAAITKKPVVASPEEIRDNPRSRSAKLRVLERVS